MLDYKLLEAMAMVITEGGFDKASKALHITQSAVSQRVKLLEELSGQVLLVRTSPPVATPAGRQMMKHFFQVEHLEIDLFKSLRLSSSDQFESMAIGINADSLATWFLPVIDVFLKKEPVTLDLRVDDQEKTQRFLRDGEVVGCISSQNVAIQGCSAACLGSMNYRLMAAPGFVSRWFPEGFTIEAVSQAPALVFNRKDELLNKIFSKVFGKVPSSVPVHFLPSSEKFVDFIAKGYAYGVLPDQQSNLLVQSGEFVDLLPGISVCVELYWHCWNLKSEILIRFSDHLIAGARKVLASKE